jgi:serine/threonine-protein kinase TTK/MPS1
MSSLDAMEDSDDEGNAPQLSALARMLLSQSPEGSPERKEDGDDKKEQYGERRRSPLSRYRSSRNRTSLSRSPNPEEGPVQSAYATVQRNGSRHGSPEPVNRHDLVTPAPGRYTRRVYSGTMGSSGSSGSSAEANKETEARHTGFSTIARPGPRAGAVPPSTGASTTRWRRGLIGGLAGAPRRGPRRESDQTDQEDQEAQLRNSSSPEDQGVREQSNGVISDSRSGSSSSTPKDDESNPEPQTVPAISRRSRRSSPESLSDQYKLSIYKSDSPGDKNSGPSDSSGRSSSPEAGVDNLVSKAADASHPTPQPEKENMPPPTFRRPTVLASSYQRLASTTEKPPLFQTSLQDDNYDKPLIASPVRTSPEKRALATKTNNTPLRPAPPPPKMSMLQAVTATAGAASTTTSQTSRRSRATVSVNGKVYRRLDAIGKGGSCKVYKVMAENFKTFAMKKVAFDGQDISAIRGYKGEIELLNKLAGEERVIRLYDYELNNDKQTLTMVSFVYNCFVDKANQV